MAPTKGSLVPMVLSTPQLWSCSAVPPLASTLHPDIFFLWTVFVPSLYLFCGVFYLLLLVVNNDELSVPLC